jgi:RecA/RadA recombinase
LKGIPVCTNEITCIAGKPKSGKSSFAAAIVAAFAAAREGKEGVDALGWSVESDDSLKEKVIVYIDTENARQKAFKLAIRDNEKRTGLEINENTLRLFTAKDMLSAPEHALHLLLKGIFKWVEEARVKVFCIIIDGIAQFVESVNDEKEATGTIRALNVISLNFDCPIIEIIHENEGRGDKMRGHLGASAARACETTLYVDKKNQVASVKSEQTRGKEIPLSAGVCFRYDEEKGLHVTEQKPTKEEQEKNKKEKKDKEKQKRKRELQQLAQKSFKKLGKRLNNETPASYCFRWGNASKDSGQEHSLTAAIRDVVYCNEAKARRIIKEMEKLEVIEIDWSKEGKKLWKYIDCITDENK